MGLVSEEHEEIARFLLPEIIELAQKHDGLVEPDKGTQQVMLRCLGTGFSLGAAYNQTSTKYPWRERLSDAFKIVKGTK